MLKGRHSWMQNDRVGWKGGSAVITHVPRKTSSSLKRRWRRFIARCYPNFSRLYFCTSDNYPLGNGYPGIWRERLHSSTNDDSQRELRTYTCSIFEAAFSQISMRRVTLSNTWRLMLAVLLTGQRSGAL